MNESVEGVVETIIAQASVCAKPLTYPPAKGEGACVAASLRHRLDLGALQG